jgi:hypothetical protein
MNELVWVPMPRKRLTDRLCYKVGVLNKRTGLISVKEECVACLPGKRVHLCTHYFYLKT